MPHGDATQRDAYRLRGMPHGKFLWHGREKRNGAGQNDTVGDCMVVYGESAFFSLAPFPQVWTFLIIPIAQLVERQLFSDDPGLVVGPPCDLSWPMKRGACMAAHCPIHLWDTTGRQCEPVKQEHTYPPGLV